MIEIPKKEPLNIVPFIDIMLVLLAMVLSISTFIAKGEIKVELPKSESSEAASPSDNLQLIVVNSEGTIHIDGKVADTSALQDFVASIPRNERIVLRIDKNTQFAHFINVVDIFKKYRHENFSIVTEKVNASEGS